MANTHKATGFLLGIFVTFLVLISALGGALADRIFVIKPLDALLNRKSSPTQATPYIPTNETEKTVVDISASAKKSVVTVSIKKTFNSPQRVLFSPFAEQGSRQVEKDIGTGFVVSDNEGLIVTNRHVVEDVQAEYQVFDTDGKAYPVTKIYRDPTNDLAIIQADIKLPALPLGDSAASQVGQSVIAIGTALGEFRQTVTTGVVSGLGRGIEANTGFSMERIDNLIQTDAAINPGNSGGPLLNMRGEVIGVNVAVAQAENIGFAIPVNTVKLSLENFSSTGKFDRPLLGVKYKVIPKETALLNDVPEGAYIIEILPGSTAEKAGLVVGDIITKIDGKSVGNEDTSLSAFFAQRKIGETVPIEFWRAGVLTTQDVVLQGTTTP
jgi:serine protease Do